MSEVPERYKYRGGYDPSDPPQGEHWCSVCSNWDEECECCPECQRSYGPHYTGPCEHGCEKPPPVIKTHFINPSIPIRQLDWAAWVDGRETGPFGYGSTEAHAIADLREQLDFEK